MNGVNISPNTLWDKQISFIYKFFLIVLGNNKAVVKILLLS